jgi:hypothetical protein
MRTRDEYVAGLKGRLDRWNTDAGKWEAQARVAHADMKKRYDKQLEMLRERREEALYNLTLVEKASATAWEDLAKGADEAWERMQEAFTTARSHFEKQPKQ